MIRKNVYINRWHNEALKRIADDRVNESEHIRRALDDYFQRPDIRELREHTVGGTDLPPQANNRSV